MKTMVRSILAGAVLAATGSLALAQEGDEARVISVSSDEWCAADLAQDLDAKLDLFAEDAVLMMPGRSPLEGAAEIRRWQDQNYALVHHDCVGGVRVDDVRIDGDIAIVHGRFSGEIVFKDGSRSLEQSGYFLNVLTADAERRWRISRMMFTY